MENWKLKLVEKMDNKKVHTEDNRHFMSCPFCGAILHTHHTPLDGAPEPTEPPAVCIGTFIHIPDKDMYGMSCLCRECGTWFYTCDPGTDSELVYIKHSDLPDSDVFYERKDGTQQPVFLNKTTLYAD